jgi:hypothetical protein
VRDQEIRTALDRHWAASDANESETEHGIYHETRCSNTRSQASEPNGGCNIQNQRASQPGKKGLLSDESLAATIFGSPNSS